MRSETEIREKISEMMDVLEEFRDDERENLCNQIDALLWVIGDESGAPIYGEERE